MKKLLLSALALFFLSFVFLNCSGKNENSKTATKNGTEIKELIIPAYVEDKGLISNKERSEKRSMYLNQASRYVYHYLMEDFFNDFPKNKEKTLKRFNKKLELITIGGYKISDGIKEFLREEALNFPSEIIPEVIYSLVKNPYVNKDCSLYGARNGFQKKYCHNTEFVGDGGWDFYTLY